MDDDGAFLASLSDEDWAKRARRVEKEFRRDQRKRRRRRGIGRIAAILVPTLVLGTLGIGLLYMLAQQGASDRDSRGEQVPVLSSLAPTRTSAPPAAPAAPAAPPDPFATTPAATWPNADVGVVMPVASPLGPLSQEQVQTYLDRAYRYLLAAKTDSAVLVNHDVSGIVAMVDAYQQKLVGADGRTMDGQYFGATLLADGTQLIAPTRVNGLVTVQWVEQTEDQAGYLLVHSNLVWAYALSAPEGYRGTYRVSTLHETRDLEFFQGSRFDGGIWVSTWDWFGHNIDCAFSDDGLLRLPRPSAEINRVSPTAATNSLADMYDPRTDLGSLHSTC